MSASVGPLEGPKPQSFETLRSFEKRRERNQQIKIARHKIEASKGKFTDNELNSIAVQTAKGTIDTHRQLVEQILTLNGDYHSFNKLADQIKEHANWQERLKLVVHDLTYEHLETLCCTQPLLVRGYDREILSIIFNELSLVTSVLPINSRHQNNLSVMIDFLTTNIITTSSEKISVLGGGAVNKVYAVSYTNNLGTEQTVVFKPDPTHDDPIIKFKEQNYGTATAAGIPFGPQAHLNCRAVASSIVDELLYGDKNRISVRTEFAVVNGQRGIVMEKAQGVQPKFYGLVSEAIDLNKHPKIQLFISQLKKSPSERDLKLIAFLLKYRSVKWVEDMDGKGQLVGKRAEFSGLKSLKLSDDLERTAYVLKHCDKQGQLTPKAAQKLAQKLGWKNVALVDIAGEPKLQGTCLTFDPTNPRVAEGLLKLQIKDIITGECDRHPQNYLIDPSTGKVTGIDEDCCFGVKALPKDGDVRKQKKFNLVVPNNASLMLRMPLVITVEMEKCIDDLYNNQELLTLKLGPLVTPDEINATHDRLARLYEHVHSADCLVVDAAEDLLSDEAMDRMDSNNSYVMRELLVFQGSKNGWNHLRSHRKY